MWHCADMSLKLPRASICNLKNVAKFARDGRETEKSRPDTIWILEPDAQEGQSHHYILKLTYSKIDFIFGIQFYKF